jgi:L-lysine 2,3-aminomutase
MLHNYKTLPQIANLPEDLIEAIDIVGSVLPFKTKNYVVENLIDWNNVPNDPIFTLIFLERKCFVRTITKK